MQKPTRAQVLALCAQAIEQRRQAAQAAMDAAQQAANQEEKSSAGDKYETGRAMAQNARDQAARQLAEAHELAATLGRLPAPAQPQADARPGTVVYTSVGVYLLGVGLGRVAAGPPAVFALSAAAPVARLLVGCQQGQTLALPTGPATVEALG